MTFNPDLLDPESRALFDQVMSEDGEVAVEKWIGSAFSALNLINDNPDNERVLQAMAVHILVHRAPARVRSLGALYDLGLL